MSSTVIQVDRLSKQYRLGQIGGKRLVDDVNRWWAKLRGKDDPLSKVGSVVRSQKSVVRGQSSVVSSPVVPSSRGPRDEAFWALRDVSFEVKQGEVLGIIGRNGAGKSTLLKILSRVTAPTSGEVRVRGRIASLLEVGTGFHPELTGRENIFLNGAILGMRKAEIRNKFDEIVAFAEVEKFIDTPVKRYSSGMYVRLAFAVAAHLEPEILIVDEVLAVGDAEFQKKCLGKMQDVAGQGRTVLFVSHNMGAVQALCSRGLLLASGSLMHSADVNSVVTTYLAVARSDSHGDFDLTSHEARRSTCLPLIVRVQVFDGNDRPGSLLSSRSEMKIVLHLKLARPIRGPRFAIAVEDAIGRRIFTTASYFYRKFPTTIQGDTTITCLIKSLPLAPGRYLLSVSLATVSEGLLDSIDGAAWFEVADNTVHETGEQHRAVYGPALVDAAWDHHG